MIEFEKHNLLTEQINWILQAIKAIKTVRFKWHQSTIQVLQAQLQTKGLKLDTLENNSMLFTVKA